MKSALLLITLGIAASCMNIRKQNHLLFEPIRLAEDHVFVLPENTKEIWIPVAEKVKLNGFLFEKNENKYLLIYFQGNAGNLQNFLDNHSMVLDWGYNVLVTDYRGFGKSGGSLSGETKMYEDAGKVYDHAIQLGYRPGNIILYGYSMGTALAGYLASTRQAKAVILESAFSSIPKINWVGDRTPRYTLNTARRAKQITIPALLIHGDRDEVITPEHSERIFDNLQSKIKRRIVIKGGGHGDLRKRQEFRKLVNDFIDYI
jgi:pimeloyl-ACP methyl ester carboxylesterase